jgi:cytochrome c oxidase cbb3-type subunit 2
MLAQSQLTQRERWAVIRYLKEFAPRFLREQPSPPIAILVPTDLNSRVERGRQLYRTAGCTTCHGEQGWGDGPAARGLTDEWGHSIRPANLTGSSLKSGDRAGDLYRTLSTGLDGTPMPSYQHTLTDDERWAVAAYIISLPRAEDTRSHGMMGGSGMGNREEHLGRMISMMQGMGMHGHGCMGR